MNARHRLRWCLLLLVTGAMPLWGGAASPQVEVTAPGKNLSLPTFNKEGWRATLLHAGTARFASQTQIDATDVIFTVFTGDASGKVETVLVSPAATALTDQEILRGDQTVRLVRDEVEVTGAKWTFQLVPDDAAIPQAKWTFVRRENRVFIGQDARVVFHAALPHLLK
jgi:hypothetical protein